MTRRVHFCNTYEEALIYADRNDGMLLSNHIHPDENHKALFHFNTGVSPLLVADISMATGWRVIGDDVVLTFSEAYPKGGSWREQAEARVRNPHRLI